MFKHFLVTMYFARYNKQLSVVDSNRTQGRVVVGVVVDMPTCLVFVRRAGC